MHDGDGGWNSLRHVTIKVLYLDLKKKKKQRNERMVFRPREVIMEYVYVNMYPKRIRIRNKKKKRK